MNEANVAKAIKNLGLAKRAGKTTCGVPLIIEALRSARKPYLVIASAKASENSIKKITDKCKFYEVEFISLPVTPDELAHSVGHIGGVAAVSVNDSGLADLVRSALTDSMN